MPSNRHAQIRYKILDSCFRNTGQDYSFEDLRNAIDEALSELEPNHKPISTRTLRGDIAFMESEAGWMADIERHQVGRQCYYRYRDPKFSINNQPLNKSELIQINTALEIIGRFNGMPQFGWVNEIITKLNDGFHLKEAGNEIISFDSNEYLKGIEFLGELFNAIHTEKALKITYRSFKSAFDVEMVIHPYYLKQYNNRWFLFGLNEKHQTISSLALDRIVSIDSTAIKYNPNQDIDFKEYFDDMIGVTKPSNGQITRIELFFDNDQAPYVLTKPIHSSQKKVSHDEDGLLISINVIPNFELERLILSFGDKVKVLSPSSLADKIVQIHQKSLNMYITG